MKRYLEIGQLQLHFKNIQSQVNKAFTEHNDVNVKMFKYNFERITLKYIKLLHDFLENIGLKQKQLKLVDVVKQVNQTLDQACRDQKARTSRTFNDDDTFSRFTNSTKFLNSYNGQQEDDDQREMDEIEQFMNQRNREIQFNLGAPQDQNYKNKQRGRLEEYLTNVDLHTQNLQKQMKTATSQRQKIKQSSLSRNKFLFKKTTLDLQRIDEICRPRKEWSHDTIVQFNESEDKEVQTTIGNRNVKWEKFYTYCVKPNEKSCQNVQSEQNGQNNSVKKSCRDSMDQCLDQYRQMYGMLEDCCVQTEQQQVALLKPPVSAKTDKSKGKKGKPIKASIKMLRNKDQNGKSLTEKSQPSRRSKMLDVNFVDQQDEQPTLRIEHKVIDQSIVGEKPVSEEMLRFTQKNDSKVLAVKQLMFQYTSKKELARKSNKFLTKSIMINTDGDFSKGWDKQKEEVQENGVNCQSNDESNSVLDENLQRRVSEKKKTLRSPSSISILKSSKLDIFNKQKVQYEAQNLVKIISRQQAQNSTQNIHFLRRTQRKDSQFKPIPEEFSKQKERSKRNSIDSTTMNKQADQKQKQKFKQTVKFKETTPLDQQNKPQQQLPHLHLRKSASIGVKLKNKQSFSQLKPSQRSDKKKLTLSHRSDDKTEDIPSTINMPVVGEQKKLEKNLLTQKESDSLRQTNRFKTIEEEKLSVSGGTLKNIQRNSVSYHCDKNREQLQNQKQNISSLLLHNRAHHKHRSNKHFHSQELPELSICKQKLSLAKKNMFMEKAALNLKDKNLLRKRATLQINLQNSSTKTTSSHKESQAGEYLKKLFLTKSYRDKLTLYLSMIELTHEKYCGSNCAHMQKFIEDMTGPINERQSVAEQIVRIYKNGEKNSTNGNSSKVIIK